MAATCSVWGWDSPVVHAWDMHGNEWSAQSRKRSLLYLLSDAGIRRTQVEIYLPEGLTL